jgi:hypothetical protein
MNDDIPTFEWAGTDNPNDPSGVARFKVGMESIAIPMNDFRLATKLDRLITKACERSKQKAIDRAIVGVSELLSKYRYD